MRLASRSTSLAVARPVATPTRSSGSPTPSARRSTTTSSGPTLNIGNSLKGGKGKDDISGNNGPDFVLGGAGNDAIRGGGGDDTLKGGGGKDNIRGSGGDDNIYGQKGKDKCNGGGGDNSSSARRSSRAARPNSARDGRCARRRLQRSSRSGELHPAPSELGKIENRPPRGPVLFSSAVGQPEGSADTVWIVERERRSRRSQGRA